MLAVMYFETGREDQARRIFEPLAASGFASVPLDYGWMRSMASCAYLSTRLTDLAAARAAYERLLPYRNQIVVTACIFGGSVFHYLGMLATALGRFAAAEDHFDASARAHARINSPTWLAQTRLEWARMLLARGEPDDDRRARALLQQALRTARDIGLGGVERRAAELLASE
ncbi:MAG TPA: tetratricopeptide repeat protein, partial [Actinomycetota bacterium]|nr:tetratricopeptide repeat protein [Actinomycetota bacterium]